MDEAVQRAQELVEEWDAELGRIREPLLCARDLWRIVPEIEDEKDQMRAIRQTFRLIHLADIVAVTPGAVP